MDDDAIKELETAESIVTTGREESKKPSNWSELPSLPLENIYSFLDVFDRINMALVCHRWYEGYSSSSSWKTFRFALTESVILKYNSYGMKFVQKYCGLIRHVDIHYHILPSLKTYIWCKDVINFLQVLTSHSQLISVKIHNMQWLFEDMNASTQHADVKRAIACFLGSQKNLKRVEFRSCFFQFEDYTELLGALHKNSKNSITHFGLREIKMCDKALQRSANATESLLAIICFPSLTTLEVDYSYIFKNTFVRQSVAMETLKNCQTRAQLSKIILNYKSQGYLRDFEGLTSTDWQALKTLYPDLKVELNFITRIPSQRDVEYLIVPDMPILWLNFIDGFNSVHSSITKTDALFTHLLDCKISDHLQSLCFKLKTPILDLSTFIPFLKACKKMVRLDLLATFPTKDLEFLLRSWLENRPASLTKVFIEISEENNDDAYKILEKLTTEYVPGLKLVGLYVKLSVKKSDRSKTADI